MIQFRFRLFFICLVASIAISIPKQECFGQAPTSPVSSVPQPKKINETVFTEPMVARVELTPDYALAHQNLGWLLATCRDESLRDSKAAIASATKACELNQFNDLSDMAALAASHASAKEFDLAIGLQEKIVERAPQPQKPLAEKILELYRSEKPFDPELNVDAASEKPVPSNGSEQNESANVKQ